MGITIHYKGKIDSRDLIPKLIEDCRDFADSMGWQYVVLDNENDILHRGIVLTVHPEAESLNLTFGERWEFAFVYQLRGEVSLKLDSNLAKRSSL